MYNGLWYTPLKKALDAFFDETQKKVTGTVRVQLYMFGCRVNGRKSRYSLYQENLATYSDKDEFDQGLAKGFIDLYSLPYQRPYEKKK